MHYVIQTGGKQYLVQKGDTLDIEKLDHESGKKVDFDVLMTIDKSTIQVGTPNLDNTKVQGEIVEHFKGEKLRVFKMKRRKRYRKNQGHRQNLTQIKIV